MKVPFIAIVLFLQYAMLFPCYCQQSQEKGQDPSHYVMMDEVVISANKVEEPLKRVNQQIMTIPAGMIQQLAPATTADLLTSVGGILVQKSQQGGGSPNLRGFEANKILLVVDGIRMNNLIYRSGHLQNIITVDPAILEKVEVLFGPSSTLYGSDALGGTIHLMTKDPRLSTEDKKWCEDFNAFLRYASANQGKTAHADFNLGTRRFGSLSSFTWNEFQDLRMGKNKNPFFKENFGERPFNVGRINNTDTLLINSDRFLQKSSGYHQVDLIQKLLFQQQRDILHKINLQYSKSTDIPRYDRLTDPSGKGLKYAQWYYGPQIRLLGAYDLTLQNRLGLNRIYFSVSGQYLEESRHTRKFKQDLLTHRTEYVNVYGANLDLQKTWGRNDLRFGAEMQLNELKSRANNQNIVTNDISPVDSRYPDGKNRMNSIDLYVTHSWQLSPKWLFNQGARIGSTHLFSSFKDTVIFSLPFHKVTQDNITYSGSAGLVYFPAVSWKLSLNLSTGFRVPNIDDFGKIFERPQNSIIVPNENLKPEKTLNTDIGVTKMLGNSTKCEFFWYGTLLRDIIIIAPFSFMGYDSILYDGSLCKVLASQNKSNAYVTGFSSTFSSRPVKGFNFQASINYTYGRIVNNGHETPINNIPPLSGKLGAGYQKKACGIDFFILYNGWKLMSDYYLGSEDNEQYATPKGTPAWVTLNIRANFDINNHLGIQLGIDNMLDTQYRVFSSGINASGRNILLTIHVKD
ncbi:MAG: TonB-dependent receptor [Bacteroidetes bacterium]|nr:TonB-dependent receptor [Bacteroidota bacterium]